MSFRSNRYSVPFRLIGKAVQARARGEQVQVLHRERLVATHVLRSGRYELSVAPEHGPGAVMRNARQRFGERDLPAPNPMHVEVEVRDLALYESLCEVAS